MTRLTTIAQKLIVELTSERLRGSVKKQFPNLFQKGLNFFEQNVHELSSTRRALEFDGCADAQDYPVYSRETSDSAMKIRIFSPLPPTISGIAKFTDDLASALSKTAPVSLRCSYFEGQVFPNFEGSRSYLYKTPKDQGLVENIYMVGNGPHHDSTWAQLLKEPGFIFLHDAKIPHIQLHPDEDKLWKILNEEQRALSYFGRVPVHTKGIITLSEETARIASRQMSDLQIEKIPIHILATGHPANAASYTPRLPGSKPKIGTFGFQNSQKNSTLAMAFMSRVASSTGASALVCGHTPASLKKELRSIWVDDGNKIENLEFIDSPNDEEFAAQMDSVDLAVQFRRYSNGETSGVIPMLAARGIPTIVSSLGSFLELQDELFHKVDPHVEHFNFYGFQESVKFASGILADEHKYQELSGRLIAWANKKTFDAAASEVLKIISGPGRDQKEEKSIDPNRSL